MVAFDVLFVICVRFIEPVMSIFSLMIMYILFLIDWNILYEIFNFE